MVGSFCHDQVVDAEPRDEVVDAASFDQVVEATGFDQVVDPTRRDQVVEATGRDQVVEAAGFDQVVDPTRRDQVVDATGRDRAMEATRAFTPAPLPWGEIPISTLQNDAEGALWVFMVPPPCAAGGVAGSTAAVGEYVSQFSAHVVVFCNPAT